MGDGSPQRTLGLFEGYGVELEYMLVDGDSLDVSPTADALLEAAAGEITAEFDRGAFAWNNELALHVIEFKTNGPVSALSGVARGFAGEVGRANALLAPAGLRLLSTGMHPWMDPAREMRIWPHEEREIYDTFDRIFSCRGHGWANLQSMHLNLPFASDDDFGRLHAAIRFLMPLMPALAASSPIMDGRITGTLCNRLAVYRENCARVPSVTGDLIPEAVYTIGSYHDLVLGRIYRDMEPHDPAGVLREEWVNARGAIARFDRMALEIRVLDTQECPRADLAYAQLIVATLRALAAETWSSLPDLQAWSTETLSRGLRAATAQAEMTQCTDAAYLRALGMRRGSALFREIWSHLAERAAAAGHLDQDAEAMVEHYLRHGSLATRILAALPAAPARPDLQAVYRRLGDCLAADESFGATA